GRLAAAEAVNVHGDPGLGDVVEADGDEVVALVPRDGQADVGAVENVGRLAVRLGRVEGEVVLAGAQVGQHVKVAATEGLGAGDGERHLVVLALQLEVEVGEQVVEDLRPAVRDHGGGRGHVVLRDRHRVGLATGRDAQAGGAVGGGVLAD